MAKFVCIRDFENYALNNLTPVVRDYYKSGAGDEDTLKLNREAFKKYVYISCLCLPDNFNLLETIN